MSERNGSSESGYKRRLRCHRTKASKYDYCLNECHHCLKSVPMKDLIKCSNASCSLFFCIACLRKYKPTLNVKTFDYLKQKQDQLCLVCKKRCMCPKCYKKGIEDDFIQVERLLAKQQGKKPSMTLLSHTFRS